MLVWFRLRKKRAAQSSKPLGEVLALAVGEHGRGDLGHGIDLVRALQRAHDRRFRVRTVAFVDAATLLHMLVHVGGLATHERFISLHDSAAHFARHDRARFHRETDAMQHEPPRFLRDANLPHDLVAAHAVLAVRHHPKGHEPFVESDRGILKNGADFYGELALGVFGFALPSFARADETNIGRAARGARNALRPAQIDHEAPSVVVLREVADRLMQRFGQASVFVHGRENAPKRSLSQVYYCPRKNDRGFDVGHILHLREYDPVTSEYSGRTLDVEVTYIVNGPAFGIEEGHCVMSIRPRPSLPPKAGKGQRFQVAGCSLWDTVERQTVARCPDHAAASRLAEMLNGQGAGQGSAGAAG